MIGVPKDPNSSPEDQFYKIEVPNMMYRRENSLELLPDPGPSQKQNYENFLKINEAFKEARGYPGFKHLLEPLRVS